MPAEGSAVTLWALCLFLPLAGDSMKSAFTLIELLVVIAIIAVLAAILFPVFSQARAKARQTTCVSNARQVGLSVLMYAQDYDEGMPIFHAYNTQPPAGVSGHLGVEEYLMPYVKSRGVFKCPDDSGGPVPKEYPSNIEYGGCSDIAAKSGSYWDCYGSSYRFTRCTFSTIAGYSVQNNVVESRHRPVSLPEFVEPANTRIMRDEMLPWFSGANDPNGAKYEYYPAYYQDWHTQGGTLIFADGHAKFFVGSGAFDLVSCSPDGLKKFSVSGWSCD